MQEEIGASRHLVLRRSETMRRWPRSLCERLMRVARTGWLSAVLVPTIITRSAFSMSEMEPESPP